jgi:hypothetical protein
MLVKRINRHHAEKSSSASYHNIILKLEDCRNEPHRDKRVKMLNQINSMLLKSDQLCIPLVIVLVICNFS